MSQRTPWHAGPPTRGIWRATARLCGLLVALAFVVLGPTPAVAQVVVRMKTVLGDIDVELDPVTTPGTVANFLRYVRDGDYDESFFHRSVPGFVIQGGGFAFDADGFRLIPADAPIPNEFAVSNQRGTIAMARLGGQPDSATNQYFINLTDNSFLDDVDGGFTVFGRVTARTLPVVDAIEALQVFDASSITPVFNNLPLIGFQPGDVFDPASTLVLVRRVLEGREGQCGDTNDDAFVDEADVRRLRLFLARPGAAPLSPDARDQCSVVGSAQDCNIADVVVLARALASLAPGIAPVCTTAQ